MLKVDGHSADIKTLLTLLEMDEKSILKPYHSTLYIHFILFYWDSLGLTLKNIIPFRVASGHPTPNPQNMMVVCYVLMEGIEEKFFIS